MKKISVIALIAFAAVAAGRADIIPSFAGTSPGSGTNTVWNYTATVTAGQQIMMGDFFTVYDFGPFISGSATSPSGWTFSSAFLTAPPAGTTPPDSPTLENLTWTYTGTTVIPTGTNLSGFAVTQLTGVFQELPSTQSGYFAALATRNDGGGSKISNVGRIPVPVPIPEPTTLSLLALAGVGSALKAIRRRK